MKFNLADELIARGPKPRRPSAVCPADSRSPDTDLLDAAVAGGMYNGRGTRGWLRARDGLRWAFVDRTGALTAGITTLILADRRQQAENRAWLLVRGRNGSYPVVSGDEPLQATVVLGSQSASIAGECAETAFAADRCVYNDTGTKLSCAH